MKEYLDTSKLYVDHVAFCILSLQLLAYQEMQMLLIHVQNSENDMNDLI